ncbi:ThuA domain-containing protein (plasmid) [Paracoccus sp. TK19116]|uniref:ThuA domain-containing protein n=1 Tax=Paracoccus albicereus TaxID=2922394 RepID=A0ABT1MLI3_9RHOB|nr:ThuA domain-containing protein [Paracoccus albicereus]MCQ0969140.1 ThuA domain-containing protein [Paracoccus albicereus]
MTIRVTVWGENVHEHKSDVVKKVYPDLMHGTIAAALNRENGIEATTATLQEPEHGLTKERLAQTDVLTWWGHAAHGDVDDAIAERVCEAVWGGMGIIFLHSAHFSKPFKRLMGTPCNLYWREAGERERIWTTSRNHPIAAGVPESFELVNEEMYGEPFGVPEPMETVFIGWFQGGEVFRSGLTWRRGAGNVFYFQPGHETYPTYHDANIQRVIANGVRWAYNPAKRIDDPTVAPNRPVDQAPEKITERGPKLHKAGEQGLR